MSGPGGGFHAMVALPEVAVTVSAKNTFPDLLNRRVPPLGGPSKIERLAPAGAARRASVRCMGRALPAAVGGGAMVYRESDGDPKYVNNQEPLRAAELQKGFEQA